MTLADEIDIARGDVLVGAEQPPRSRRSVHRAFDLDERGADAAGALVFHEDRDAHHASLHHRSETSHRCQQLRKSWPPRRSR